MRCAFDFSEVPGPSADEIKANGGEGALVYGTGAQQSPEYVRGLETAGLHVPLIWEHNRDSILGGFDYGVSECQAWEASHPAGLVYLACDLNDGDLGAASVEPFCSGWCSVTREAVVGLYGPDHSWAQVRGIVTKMARMWGVVNWLENGAPNNDPANVARWTELGASIIQLIGSPIDGTDQNLILRDDWWTTGGALPKAEPPMYDYFATSPWDPTQLQVWWIYAGGHQYVGPEQWAAIKANAVFNGFPVPKPFKGTPEMFNAAPDANAKCTGTGTAPTTYNIELTGQGKAA